MRTQEIFAAVVLALSCGLGVVACIQSPDPTVEADESDPGAIGVFDDAIGNDLESLERRGILEQCIASGKSGTAAREQFCRMVPPDKSEPCWSRIYASRVAWNGWCYWNFS